MKDNYVSFLDVRFALEPAEDEDEEDELGNPEPDELEDAGFDVVDFASFAWRLPLRDRERLACLARLLEREGLALADLDALVRLVRSVGFGDELRDDVCSRGGGERERELRLQ
jgi:hypothetical protein